MIQEFSGNKKQMTWQLMRMRNEVGNFSLINSPCHWFQTLDSIGIQARVFNSRCIKDLQ